MKRWLAFSAVFLTTSCVTAGFQFSRLDANDDERISRKEAEESVEISAYFPLFDRNEDGYLDQEELADGLDFIQASDAAPHERSHGDRGGHGH